MAGRWGCTALQAADEQQQRRQAASAQRVLLLAGQAGRMFLEREELVNAVSGAIAGVVTAVFVCPLDVLKTRMQVGLSREGLRSE